MSLKASPESQARLLELQASDTRIRQVEHKTKMIPELALLESLGAEAETVRQRLLGETGAVEDARLELSRIESDVEVVETRIGRNTERLATSSSTKDIAAFEQELVSLRKRRDDLEEIQLTVMERLDELEAVVALTREGYDQLRATIAAAEAERDASLLTLTSEQQHEVKNREEIAAALPADLLELYERQRSRYGLGASFLQYGVSTASGVRLNENDMAAIRAAAPDDVVLCPDSQAILVRTKESGL